MTDIETQDTSAIAIRIGQKTYNVNPELFRGYKDNIFEALAKAAKAKDQLTGEIETLSETTGIPKGVLTKYFKAKFDEKTEQAKEIAQAFDGMDELLES
jgi:hypothetical protein